MSYRKVTDVYKQISPIIPTDNSGEKLNNELKVYIESLWNMAPEELMGNYCWGPFINILNSHITEIKDPWHLKIQEILLNKKN